MKIQKEFLNIIRNWKKKIFLRINPQENLPENQ